MQEHLTKAGHDATFCADALQEAHSRADPVSAILLLPLIGEARALALRIEELTAAITTREQQEGRRV